MTETNGSGPGKPPMQPMPQSGVYPIERFCQWLECSREDLLARFEVLGVAVTHGTADMAELLSAIERQADGEEE